LSKNVAIFLVGILGVALSFLGVSSEWDWAGLALNLGSGFVGSFTTYLLFDTFIAAREEKARRVSELVGVFHSRDLGQKNYVLSRWPRENVLEGASVYGADLSRTEWEKMHCKSVDFAFCTFSGAIFEDCTFEACSFKDVKFDGTTGSKSRMLNCNFEGCSWVDSLWPDSSFSPSVPIGVPALTRGGEA